LCDQHNLEESKTNKPQCRLKIREGSGPVRSELPVWCFVM